MKVLMLSAAYAPDGGGVATHVANLVHGLAKRHVGVSVFTLNRPSAPTEAEPGQFDHVLKQKRKMVPAYDGRRVFAEAMIEDILKKWSKINPDLVHCHDFDSLFVGWLLKAGSEKTLPLVLTLHRAPSPWREQRHLEDSKDLFLWTAVCSKLKDTGIIDAVVVPSQSSADVVEDCFAEIRRVTKIAIETQVSIIKHGITDKLLTFKERDGLLESLGCAGDRILVFCPCRADEHKDVEVFLAAAGILKKTRPSLRLFFLLASEDRGPNSKQVRNCAKSNGLVRGVDVAFRKFEYEEMATVYRRARVCVVPSRHESFGLVILEAFLMGVPVVAANSTGLAEIVTNRQNGMQFTPGKSKELAGQIERLLDDDELSRVIVAKAKSQLLAKGEYSSERMSSDYEHLYWRLLGAAQQSKEAPSGLNLGASLAEKLRSVEQPPK